MTPRLMQGNEAVSWGALAAGCRFFAGYPITPSTEIAEIPCVIVNVQRLGPSTGQPTSASQGDVMQARWGTHGDHSIIALYPTSVRQSFDLTVTAFNLAEKY